MRPNWIDTELRSANDNTTYRHMYIYSNSAEVNHALKQRLCSYAFMQQIVANQQ